ncbi:MAG: alcohol dehydrogenase catalytic domain-containing protein [Actinobacteria bacterium]|jgi:2-desacetyl-2-hydroxyethyl bacteriochlorophyllide A dehydrogenase|nr:alcohol dehydrogenase catalytic domain-containing protein [Actinomycetota bacterium]
MKSLITPGDKTVALIEVADPKPIAGEILVAPIYAGVCATDIEVINGELDPDFVVYPATLGHEWCGRVVGHGPGVSEPAIGSRIVVTGLIPCKTCFECLAGATNRCLTYSEIGFTRPGAAAELVTVPAFLAHVVADSVSNETAVLAEPTAVVTQAFTNANPKPGAKILIVGDGTIAMIAASLAKTFQPSLVHMLGLKPGQAEMAKRAGVDAFLTEPTEQRYDIIIEAAGSMERITGAIKQLVRGGTLVLVGYTGFGNMTPIMVDSVINGEIKILGSFASTVKAWATAVELMNSGKLDLSYLVTHKFPLADFAKAIDALKNAPAPRGKVALVISA